MKTISALCTVTLFALFSSTAAADDLSITPTNGFNASGLPGGPFILGTTNLTLTNTGVATLGWSLVSTASWLSATPSSGSIAPGDPATMVTVSLTPAANSLPFGSYSANIWFTNLNNSVTQAIPFTLAIDLVQNGGFETGDFTGWALTGPLDVSSYNIVTNTSYPYYEHFPPHSGDYFALLGEETYEGLAHLTQTIPTIPGQLYQISFWVNFDNLTPNEFLFNWNGQTLFDQVNITDFTPNVWTNFQFTATATASNTVIDFGAADDNSYFGLDDVSVQPVISPLRFQSVSKSGGSLQLTWNSSSGVVYQLQYNTNLAGTNWIDTGNSITATTATVSASTSITTDPQRFYRVQQLP